MRRWAGARPAEARAARLLQWLEPRAACGQIRHTTRQRQNLVAQQPARYPLLPRTCVMAYSEDHIALAAEYALGTLDADERALVETMLIVDTGFREVGEGGGGERGGGG